jgi:hypothetical protein
VYNRSLKQDGNDDSGEYAVGGGDRHEESKIPFAASFGDKFPIPAEIADV